MNSIILNEGNKIYKSVLTSKTYKQHKSCLELMRLFSKKYENSRFSSSAAYNYCLGRIHGALEKYIDMHNNGGTIT